MIPEASTVIKKRITTTEIIIDGTPVVAPEQPDVGVRTVIYAGDSSSSDDEETTVVVTKEVEGIVYTSPIHTPLTPIPQTHRVLLLLFSFFNNEAESGEILSIHLTGQPGY